MGQWNLHPDSTANFPPRIMRPAVAEPGNLHDFNFYPTPPYNVVNPELPVANLDFTVTALSAHCNPCLPPLSEWNISYTKSSDRAPMNYQFQGNYIVPNVQMPANPWSYAPNSCYLHGYQTTDINSGATGFPHRPSIHFHSNMSSYSMQQINSSNTGISNAAGAGTMFLPPIPPTCFWLYGPCRREVLLDPNARQHFSHHMRVLPEDEVAILEIPGYREADSIDQHRDMRLDIDHMSYEELLALGEDIGSVRTGLTKDFIRNNLKMHTFMPSPTCHNLEQSAHHDQPKLCVICQADYECKEFIGRLDCGHRYHGECITRWLLVRNSCPVCKATALSSKRMDF